MKGGPNLKGRDTDSLQGMKKGKPNNRYAGKNVTGKKRGVTSKKKLTN